MKKILALSIACLTIIFALIGCGQSKDPKNHWMATADLDTILERIYEAIPEDELPMVASIEITPENEEYYIGATGLAYEEAVASDAMITSIPFSVCLIKMKDGEDIEAAKTAIRENVNPRKWICVEVPEDKVVVDSFGNLIILIMSENSDAIHQSFLALTETEE